MLRVREKKVSYIDQDLWVSEHSWIIALNDCPYPSRDKQYVRIIIDGIFNQQRFLVEYRVYCRNSIVYRIQRMPLDPPALGCIENFTISYPATPQECQALDWYLEDLSNLLKENEGFPSRGSEMELFRIKRSIFNWCVDRMQVKCKPLKIPPTSI